MRKLCLDTRLRKRSKVQTTDSKHYNPIAPRLFKTKESFFLILNMNGSPLSKI